MRNEFHIKGIYSTEACTIFQLTISHNWLLNTHTKCLKKTVSQQHFNRQTIHYAKYMSLYFYSNTEFSNYIAANMLVKARRPSLVQRLHRPYAVSYNENPEAALYIILVYNTCSSTYIHVELSFLRS
jgi:hypothetical protein